MPLLGPSTNADYSGAPLAGHFLGLLGALSLVPGLIHSFLPDGGAGVIAGLDLSSQRGTIVGVFAWAGATQIVWGATLLAVSVRYRSLVPMMLALAAAEQTLIALNLWVLKPAATGHHPPGAYGALVAVPLVLAALFFSLKERSGASPAPARRPGTP